MIRRDVGTPSPMPPIAPVRLGPTLGLERCDVESRKLSGQIPCYQIRQDVGG